MVLPPASKLWWADHCFGMWVEPLLWSWFLPCPGPVLPGWAFHMCLVISPHLTACAWKMLVSFLHPACMVHVVTQLLPCLAIELLGSLSAILGQAELWYFWFQTLRCATNTLTLRPGHYLGLTFRDSPQLICPFPSIPFVLVPGDQAALAGDGLREHFW